MEGCGALFVCGVDVDLEVSEEVVEHVWLVTLSSQVQQVQLVFVLHQRIRAFLKQQLNHIQAPSEGCELQCREALCIQRLLVQPIHQLLAFLGLGEYRLMLQLRIHVVQQHFATV